MTCWIVSEHALIKQTYNTVFDFRKQYSFISFKPEKACSKLKLQTEGK